MNPVIEEVIALINEVKPMLERYRGYGPIVDTIINDLGKMQDFLRQGNVSDAKALLREHSGTLNQYREYVYDVAMKFDKIKAKMDELE